ncbi:MAG: hypothetical protein AAB943_01080 [Patescibacteria group bacterium]
MRKSINVEKLAVLFIFFFTFAFQVFAQGSDGSLGGYSGKGGIRTKRTLLIKKGVDL